MAIGSPSEVLQTPVVAGQWRPFPRGSWGASAAASPSTPVLSPVSEPALQHPSSAHAAMDASVNPRALRFSTPRTRRGVMGQDEDVEALCSELDQRVKALQLSRLQDASAQPSTAGTPLPGQQYISFDSAPTNDWASARRQIHHSSSLPTGSYHVQQHPGTPQLWASPLQPAGEQGAYQWRPPAAAETPPNPFSALHLSTPWSSSPRQQQQGIPYRFSPGGAVQSNLGTGAPSPGASAPRPAIGVFPVTPTPTIPNPFSQATGSFSVSPGAFTFPPSTSQQAFGASPAGSQVAHHDWPGDPGRHPASAPPYLGAASQSHKHSGYGIPPVDLWALRLLPSPSQIHISQKKAKKDSKGALSLMSPEEVQAVMQCLGILPFLDRWRDVVRQWFAARLLQPLVEKILLTPREVTEAAAALGLGFEVSPLLPQEPGAEIPLDASSLFPPVATSSGNGSDSNKAVEARAVQVQGRSMPEDEALQQLLWSLQHLHQWQQQQDKQQQQQQPQGMTFHLPQQQQQQQQQVLKLQREANTLALQRAMSAAVEFQQLKELLSGKWGNGLMPHGGMSLAYALSRIQELAGGSCVKAFKWDGGADNAMEFAHTVNGAVTVTVPPPPAPRMPPSPWTLDPLRAALPLTNQGTEWPIDVPTDSLLLAYLFCAHLAHPGWVFSSRLHQGSAKASAATSLAAGVPPATYPLFVGAALPTGGGANRKFLAVVEGAQGALSSDCDTLVVSRHLPPAFGLFWDRKLQLCIQGRTALWDTIIVLVDRIRHQHLSLLGTPGVAPGQVVGGQGNAVVPGGSPLLELVHAFDATRIAPTFTNPF